jgi:multiple sugar transport system permease protein/putative aldouronate transport system permease protein
MVAGAFEDTPRETVLTAARPGSSIRDTHGDRIFNAVNFVVLSVYLLIILYPLVYIVSASFSSPAAVTSGLVRLWPVDPTTIAYETIFKDPAIVRGFLNSVFYAVAGTAVNVVLTLLAAYPLSRPDLRGRGWIMFFFFFTTLFSGGLIPTYLVVRDLGLLNTRWALILPAALSVWNVIITRTYFQATIPGELLDAARIDGASDFRFLRDVVLPLSGPIVAVNALFYAVGHWNAYFDALIYLNDESLYPLQLELRQILVQNQTNLQMTGDIQSMLARENLADLLKYALIVVSTVPLLLVYPFVQKHFVKGALIGSLKG